MKKIISILLSILLVAGEFRLWAAPSPYLAPPGVTEQEPPVIAYYDSGEISDVQNVFVQRIQRISRITSMVAGILFIFHIMGGFDWYYTIKSGKGVNDIIYTPGIILDMITGVLIWGLCDIVSQYLNEGRIRWKQSILVGSWGIFQGSSTHILFNSVTIFVPLILSNILTTTPSETLIDFFKTCCTMPGGLIISLVFGAVTTIGRKISGAADYRLKNEIKKIAEMLLVKLCIAFIAIYIIINVLPEPIRVFSTQIYDFFMTLFTSYLLNRPGTLFIHLLPTMFKKKPAQLPIAPAYKPNIPFPINRKLVLQST